MESNAKNGTSLRRGQPERRSTRSLRESGAPSGGNIRKLLPSLLLGVAITLLALLFNSLVYDHRLPAMAVGNRLFDSDGADEEFGGKSAGPGTSRLFRILAGVVNLSDDVVIDLMHAVRGPDSHSSTRDRIAVVAIDEASILRRGSWPWPRRDIAMLLEKMADARVVGLDLIFADPDRTSLSRYVDSFEKLYGRRLPTDGVDAETMDSDVRLARAVSESRTVLGSLLHNGIDPRFKPDRSISGVFLDAATPNGERVHSNEILLKRSGHLITDIPIIRDNQPPPLGEGFVNLFPTPGGAVRTIPLFAHLPGTAFSENPSDRAIAYPSLALEVLRVSLDGDSYRVNLRGDLVIIPEFRNQHSSGNRYPVASVSIMKGDDELLRIPLNELGEMAAFLNNHRREYEIYPAWEVLEGLHDGAFAGKLVLVGGTGEGSGDVVSAGPPRTETSVVESHAAMLSAMLKRDFMDSGFREDYHWQQVAIIASGLAVTLAIIFGSLAMGMLASSLTLLGLVMINYFVFFRRGMAVGLTLPLLSTLAVLAVLLVTNYLVVGRERRFIRKAFSLNVSPSILGYLESHPDRLSSLQGENRHMTVLFTDIRGFTSISERMTAPDLARFLNEYFTPMSDIVMQNSGTVDKFIGDGLMAFWNAPANNPEHAIDACCAALDMLDKLGELQAGWTARGLPRVSIGCGINTGNMFAGYMGSEQRKNYTVMGDNVNIASRLENLNKLYSSNILITESTLEALKNGFVCRVVDKVRVSGKAAAVVIYELLKRGPASDEENEELAAFRRVFELYQEREFAAAESLLKELVFIRPTPLYKMYLDRLAIYKALPPPADWDGTFAMTTK